MIKQWILEKINNINVPTMIATICTWWIWRELVNWRAQRNLQSQKAELDRQLEIAKTACQRDIQTHYLQTQLKIASFYKAYPEVNSAFKEAEGSVYQLFYHSIGGQKETYKIWCNLTKVLADHSLFLDDELENACIIAKDSLMDGIRSFATMNKAEKDVTMKVIHEKVNIVTNLMRARLVKSDISVSSISVEVNEEVYPPIEELFLS